MTIEMATYIRDAPTHPTSSHTNIKLRYRTMKNNIKNYEKRLFFTTKREKHNFVLQDENFITYAHKI